MRMVCEIGLLTIEDGVREGMQIRYYRNVAAYLPI